MRDHYYYCVYKKFVLSYHLLSFNFKSMSDWNAEIVKGNNDMPLVLLKNGSTHSAEVYLHGATVTSWIHDSVERIFVSSKAIWNGNIADYCH